MLVESYEEGRLLWDAKGWIVEAVATEIAEDPKLADFKLASSTLHRYSGTKRHLPPPIAAKIEGLKTYPKREHLTEIVEAGLRVMRGQPQPSLRDPHELALALLAHFPTDEFALKFADAIANGASGKASPLAKLARRMALLVAKRLGGAAASGDLDTLQLTLNHTDAMVGVLAAKMDTSEVQRRKDKRDMLTGVCGTGLVVVASVFVAHCQHAPTAAPPAQVTVNVKPGQGVTEGTANTQPSGWLRVPYLGTPASSMGERKPALRGPRMMPHEELPGQAVKPCPEATSTLYGACWIETKHVAPCPSNQFQEGQSCYVPVQADPNIPVGETTQPPNPEQH